jgi:hypothetical protein
MFLAVVFAANQLCKFRSSNSASSEDGLQMMMDRAFDAVVRLPRRVSTRLAQSDRSRLDA